MNNSAYIAIFCILMTSSYLVHADNEWINIESHEYAGITTPEVISGFIRGKVMNNETNNPGSGVTIPYSSPEVAVTVYIYDLGMDSIPEGPRSDIVFSLLMQVIKEVEAMVEYGLYQKAILKEKYGTGSPERGHEFLCAEFEVELDGTILDTYIYVTGHNGKFVKIRITMPANIKQASVAREFADNFAHILWPNGRSGE